MAGIALYDLSGALNDGVRRVSIVYDRCQEVRTALQSGPFRTDRLISFLGEVDAASSVFQKFGALPKMAEYAALHPYPYNDDVAGAGKDLSADFYVLIGACEAVATWITGNVPSHEVAGVRYLLVSYFGGLNGRVPQQRMLSTEETAPLVALIDDLLAAIENIVAQPA